MEVLAPVLFAAPSTTSQQPPTAHALGSGGPGIFSVRELLAQLRELAVVRHRTSKVAVSSNGDRSNLGRKGRYVALTSES